MKHERPDYFVEAPSVEDAVLRRIKGNFRRKMVLKSLQTGDLASTPELWRAHDISENLKNVLTSTNAPQGRGGEDLPPPWRSCTEPAGEGPALDRLHPLPRPPAADGTVWHGVILMGLRHNEAVTFHVQSRQPGIATYQRT
jgi:hypothetical protein